MEQKTMDEVAKKDMAKNENASLDDCLVYIENKQAHLAAKKASEEADKMTLKVKQFENFKKRMCGKFYINKNEGSEYTCYDFFKLDKDNIHLDAGSSPASRTKI